MSNISIVDYLKMAAGYNRNDSGTMHRRSISPWAQSLNSSNQNSSPNNFNNQAIPQPPPPPMFRDDRTAMPQRHFPYRENISRNPFERSSDSYSNNRNFTISTFTCNSDCKVIEAQACNSGSGSGQIKYMVLLHCG